MITELPVPQPSENESDLSKVSDREFLKSLPNQLRTLYQEIMTQAGRHLCTTITPSIPGVTCHPYCQWTPPR